MNNKNIRPAVVIFFPPPNGSMGDLDSIISAITNNTNEDELTEVVEPKGDGGRRYMARINVSRENVYVNTKNKGMTIIEYANKGKKKFRL